ncbi:hypothetical protein ACX3UD_10430 [Staphylococcus haemolyticus]
MKDLYSSMIELQGKENDWSIEMNTNKSNVGRNIKQIQLKVYMMTSA